MFAWSGRQPRWTPLVRTVLVGTALSVAVELTQLYVRFRFSSLTDIALNATSTFGGAAAAMVYAAVGTSLRIPILASSRLDPAALSVLLLWLATRLAPFVPTIDWQKYKDALKPLFIEPRIDSLGLLRYVTGWLVVGYAVRLLTRREYALHATLAIVAIVLLGRVVVVGKTMSASEVAALAVCMFVAPLLIAMPERRRVTGLSMLVVVAIVAQGVPQPQAFSWMPFRSSIRGSIEANYSALFEKSFWYFSLIWLLTRGGWRVGVAAFATASLLAAVEVAQMWMPGRTPDVTDSLIALVAGLLLAMPRERSGQAAAHDGGAAPRTAHERAS
jgi:VanZ family protein